MIRRSSGGRFLAEQPRDTHFLLAIVRDVATASVGGSTRDPRSVTHTEFKQAATLPELVELYGQITTPNAICASFPDGGGGPIRWRPLLDLAFDDDRSETAVRFTHAARQRASKDPDLGEGHVHFALNYVVRSEATRTGQRARFLRTAQYDAIRARLIATDRRRKTPHDIERMLPTVDQIERVAGGWWRALEIAGLELPTATTPAGQLGIPLVDGVLRYYVATGGFLPSHGQMLDFASDFRFSLQRFVGGGPRYDEILDEARAEIARRGLPVPEPYLPRSNPGVQPPEGYEPDPDDPIYQEKHYWNNKPLVLQFVIEYLDWLGARPSSEKLWKRFRAEKALWGVPLPGAVVMKTR